MKAHKVVAISLYEDDIVALDAKVQRAKARRYTKMSRSQLIRIALDRLDPDSVTDDEVRSTREGKNSLPDAQEDPGPEEALDEDPEDCCEASHLHQGARPQGR